MTKVMMCINYIKNLCDSFEKQQVHSFACLLRRLAYVDETIFSWVNSVQVHESKDVLFLKWRTTCCKLKCAL